MQPSSSFEIIAFHVHDQQFCVKTTSIREIRGWGPSTPLPQSPPEMIGVMNLRGTVIPIVDLALKLGLPAIEASTRSAIVVAEVGSLTIGMLVDNVSDILTIAADTLQPVPDLAASTTRSYSEGIIAQTSGMICFLSLERLFEGYGAEELAA
jgi:purine-binding chemotaxis protein CheW